MPELPEVETIVRGLRRGVRGRVIKGVWTDWPKYFHKPKGQAAFVRCVRGKRVLGVERRAKNILFRLSDDHVMLVHQKMTGHLMMGRWQKPTKKVLGQLDKKWEGEKWVPDPPQGPLAERMNRFIRLIFFFDDGKMMALSDIRRFAKVICGPRDFVLNLPDIKNLGPEPLGVGFTYEKFEKLFRGKRGKIKQVLMDPTFISGIGNIYADEILWSVRVYPLMPTESLNKRQIKAIYLSMREILKKAVRLRGTSIGDYRDAAGRLGRYGGERLAYGLEGEPCQRCRTKLKRIKMGGRSSTFCPNCQKP